MNPSREATGMKSHPASSSKAFVPFEADLALPAVLEALRCQRRTASH
jgi:hypothetical protein